MTALTFTVNGTDITSYIDRDSIQGVNNLTQRQDTLQFSFIDPAAALEVTGKQEVIVTDDTGTRWFGGLVGQVVRQSETAVRIWEVHVQGYTTLLDSKLANKVYNQWTDAAIIADLILTYLPELGLNLAGAPFTTIDHIAFPYKTLAECLDALCNITGNKYYVDPNKTLYYLTPQAQLLSASIILSDQPNDPRLPGYNPAMPASYGYEGSQITEDVTQLQNRVYVIGGDYIAPPHTDTFTGDGSTTVFNLAFKPDSASAVTQAGTSVGFGHSGVDSYGGSRSIVALIDDAGQTITFQTAPPNGQAIAVTYTYRTPVVARTQDASGSFAYYGNRWYESKVTDSTLLSAATGVARGQTVLGQYTWAQWQAKLKTRAPWTRSGLAVTVVNRADDVNRNFLVQATTWTLPGGGLVYQDLDLIG